MRLTATRIASGPPRLAATTTTSAPSRHRHAPQRRSMRTPKARPRGHRPHVGNAARATPPSEVVAAAPRHAKAVAERGHERRPKALANREHDPPAKAVPNGRPRGAM
ncbi:MAG TPA: hypothetical protein VGW75_18315 [Solirubrobacteraceae bacterium]|nr:hypothetical protein [Solirubrobacteraceae bacterium]